MSIFRVHFLLVLNCAPGDIYAYASNKSAVFAKNVRTDNQMYIENPHLHDPIPKMEKHAKRFSRIDRTNETRATRQIWSSP